MTDRERGYIEIDSIISFLKDSLEYGSNLLGHVCHYIEEDGKEISCCGLNSEAMSELLQITKKISSKADVLQNKAKELSKLIF